MLNHVHQQRSEADPGAPSVEPVDIPREADREASPHHVLRDAFLPAGHSATEPTLWPGPLERDMRSVIPSLASYVATRRAEPSGLPSGSGLEGSIGEFAREVATLFATSCVDVRSPRLALVSLDPIRYNHVLPVDVTLEATDGRDHVCIRPHDGIPLDLTALAAFGLARWLNELTRPTLSVSRLILSIPPGAIDRQPLQRIGVPVVVDCPVTRLELVEGILDHPTALPECINVASVPIVSDLLRSPRRVARLELRLRHALRERLGSASSSSEEMAKELGYSARTLQRRLREAGTTFGHVLDGLRHEEAKLSLSQSNASIGEIARRVGFAEQSSFNRAFRRWAGCSPSAWVRRAVVLPERFD